MPREWIDRGTLLREYWKKQKSKQMTRLEELEATRDAAYARKAAADAAFALDHAAWAATYDAAYDAADAADAANAAASAAWATAYAADATYDAAYDAYQSELKKQEEKTND